MAGFNGKRPTIFYGDEEQIRFSNPFIGVLPGEENENNGNDSLFTPAASARQRNFSENDKANFPLLQMPRPLYAFKFY
jgi:hypothetical protein